MAGPSIAGKAKATTKPKAPAKPTRKRTTKPPAKKPRARAKRARGQKETSGWRRNVADRWVIHWRVFERMPWKEIVARDGRQERTLRRVVDDYLKHVEEGDFMRTLDRDPIELIESMLNELTVMRDVMVGLVQSSDQEAVVVAAGREWRRLVKEVRELLQGIGKLPHELGTMRHLVEVRELADVLDRLLDRLEAGTITPQELRAQVAEWSGVQQLPPAPVEGEPVADAEVVAS
jgi:hypothetical protein